MLHEYRVTLHGHALNAITTLKAFPPLYYALLLDTLQIEQRQISKIQTNSPYCEICKYLKIGCRPNH
ncbi:hypothetical protein XELAEV_18042072mg [Xenopus laevis]|uniref:Uncharacterized protein n=1 Tax=Xenopus laevis TaxID=8355 RepID=A0A974H5R3_XENLA|nr:hypothetical protein XELAEV_18042072mg [Xenopus laevis]